MESQRLIEIANDVENKSNKDLLIVVDELSEEFEKTKELIIDLTRHLVLKVYIIRLIKK